jgi:hypothetical protein
MSEHTLTETVNYYISGTINAKDLSDYKSSIDNAIFKAIFQSNYNCIKLEQYSAYFDLTFRNIIAKENSLLLEDCKSCDKSYKQNRACKDHLMTKKDLIISLFENMISELIILFNLQHTFSQDDEFYVKSLNSYLSFISKVMFIYIEYKFALYKTNSSDNRSFSSFTDKLRQVHLYNMYQRIFEEFLIEEVKNGSYSQVADFTFVLRYIYIFN